MILLEMERKKIRGAIPLRVDFVRGGAKTIYPVLLCDGEHRILVDCGYPGFLPLLERASEDAGVPFFEITGVVVTHHDYDHCGAMADIKEKYPGIMTMASAPDALVIEGKEKSVRLRQAQSIRDGLSESEKIRLNEIRAGFESMKLAHIDAIVKGGDVMPWCGGTEIIATPGHLPGHISMFLRNEKTVVTGDALVALSGRLRVPASKYSFDAETAKMSAKKLLLLDADRFICYHGGVVER
ncbi:MAG: MBL fold metallo-hydrolase [Synergistaceae bacterium]|jgi:glyoxylase-like metal-dependent hydrolase (beta-lactamase superfamily II)|nr:MBL fold metallo-hydrolase [Synergistaceae bacterium]